MIGNRLFLLPARFTDSPGLICGQSANRGSSGVETALSECVFELRTVREFLRTVRRSFFCQNSESVQEGRVSDFCTADSLGYCSGLSASSVLCAVCSFEFQIVFCLLRWVSTLPRTLFVLLSRVGLGNFALEISFALEVILGQRSNISKEI